MSLHRLLFIGIQQIVFCHIQVKEDVMKRLDLFKPLAGRPRVQFGNEYMLARQHFRCMLAEDFSELQTLSDDPVKLNPTFVDCVFTCTTNMENYIQAMLAGRKPIISCVSSSNITTMAFPDLIKISKKKLRLVPAHLKGDISTRLMECASSDEAIDILDEIEDIYRRIDYSLDDPDYDINDT